MNAINFHYWLQGSLELETVSFFTEKQTLMIKDHISLVNNKSYFIGWIDGFLEGKKSLNKKQFSIVKEKLSEEFLQESSMQRVSPLDDIRRPDLRTAVIC